MPRVIAYARVSTDKQDIDNQMFEIKRYAETHELVITDYVEETISGTKPVSQRQLGVLIGTLASGDTLIVSEASRISRKLNEIFSVIQQLIDMGVTVIAVKQNFVFADDIQSKVIAFAFGLASQIERDLIASRTRETLARLKSEGVILGRPVGSSRPEHKKLYGKDEEIIHYLDSHVPKAVMARMFGVNVKTVKNYIAAQGLVAELRQRKLKQFMDETGDLTSLQFDERLGKLRK